MVNPLHHSLYHGALYLHGYFDQELEHTWYEGASAWSIHAAGNLGRYAWAPIDATTWLPACRAPPFLQEGLVETVTVGFALGF